MIANINEILVEWAYRTKDGKPNPKSMAHQIILEGILREFGWNIEQRGELLRNLQEVEPKDKEPELDDREKQRAKDMGLIWKGKGYGKENEDGITHHNVGGKLVKVGEEPEGDQDGKDKAGDITAEPDAFDRFADKDKKTQKKAKDTQKQKAAGKKKKAETAHKEKSSEVRSEIYGHDGMEQKSETLIDSNSTSESAPPGDGEIKQLCLEHGYKDFEEDADRGKPAPGNAGSMFNEIISGEGNSILDRYPDLTEEELARVLYDQFCGTKLGNEVKSNSLDTGVGAGDIPSDVEGKDKGCYSKCLVTARSAKRKKQRAQESADAVRESGGEFGEVKQTHSFYGHQESLDAQVALIKKALSEGKKVYAPDGTLITDIMSEEELYKLILEGGSGANPSDTATFVEDENGNLILMFTSDKMTTSDQQANSTLINEINNRKKTIENLDPRLSAKDEKAAIAEIDRHKEEVDVEQQKLKKIVAPVGERMLKDADANHPQATDDFIEEWESDGDGLATAAHWEVWQEAIAKDNGWTDRPLTQEQKRCAARLLMKVTAGEANRPIDPNTDRPQRGGAPEVEEKGCKTKRWLSNDMAKIPARSAARQHKAGKPGYNIKEHIETIRRNIIRMERNHLAKLNEITVMVDGKEKGLGEIIEGQQIVDQLHLQMMDEDDQGHPMMSHGLFEVNMGGHPVNKEVLQECLSEGDEDFNSEDFIKGFKVMAPDVDEPGDRYSWSCNLPPKEPKPKDPKNPTKKENSAHKKWKTKWGNATNPDIDKDGEIGKGGSGDCADGTPRRATGRVMFIYAVVQKEGGGTRLVKVAEKNMRTKTGDLGKYDTTVTYHDDMKKCIEEASAKQ